MKKLYFLFFLLFNCGVAPTGVRMFRVPQLVERAHIAPVSPLAGNAHQ